jgi:hypothetical protein
MFGSFVEGLNALALFGSFVEGLNAPGAKTP